MNILIEGQGTSGMIPEERFCTIFPHDPDEMPQDFPTYKEAIEYGNEIFGEGNYEIESPF